MIFSKVIAVRHRALFGFYAAYIGSSVPMFRETPKLPSSRFNQSKRNATSFDCFALEDGTDSSSLNVGAELPLFAA